jgi:2-polyprenyl-6-methoxyphenol hydroxylase-like FAD-dependent oxidoreductase
MRRRYRRSHTGVATASCRSRGTRRRTEPYVTGGRIHDRLFGPGLDESDRLGLLPGLASIHYPVGHLVLVDDRGRSRLSLPYPELRRCWFRDRHYNFMRGDLARLLYAKVDPPVVRFGVTVRSCAQDDAEVHVTLSDGTATVADLLVGADGVHSKVRALAFGPEKQFLRPLGYRAAAFVIANSWLRLSLDDFITITVPQRQVAIYPIREGLATFFLRKVGDEAARDEDACGELDRHYGDLDWVLPELLYACDETKPVYLDDVAQIVMPEWHVGRIGLVGDACGCVSLLAGQGASMAVFGASMLADALSSSPTVGIALERYQRTVQPLVARRQAAGRTLAKWFVPDTALRLAARDLVLRLSLSPLVAPLIRRQIAA